MSWLLYTGLREMVRYYMGLLVLVSLFCLGTKLGRERIRQGKHRWRIRQGKYRWRWVYILELERLLVSGDWFMGLGMGNLFTGL